MSHRRRIASRSAAASSTSRRPAADGERRWNIWVGFNGEIYNHRESQASVETLGTGKDHLRHETLLHAYEESEKTSHTINGEFALVLLTNGAEWAMLARDRLGIRRLLRGKSGRLYFASEITALNGYPGLPRHRPVRPR